MLSLFLFFSNGINGEENKKSQEKWVSSLWKIKQTIQLRGKKKILIFPIDFFAEK